MINELDKVVERTTVKARFFMALVLRNEFVESEIRDIAEFLNLIISMGYDDHDAYFNFEIFIQSEIKTDE